VRHALLISEFLSTPWALQPERLSAFAGVIARWAADAPRALSDDRIVGYRAQQTARRQTAARASSGTIAVLPLYGVISQRGNQVDDISGPGSTSIQIFTRAFREAMSDESVKSIIIDVDSPGGSVYGVGELANEIYAARGKKNVVAVANSLAASAAYWIATAAAELYVTPGGEVGSIGVYLAHEDWSKHLEELGVKTTWISAGKYKTENVPTEPLSAEAIDFMKSRVEDYYSAFTNAVSRARGVPISKVRNGMGQARVLGAQAAKAENMIDGIATFDEVLGNVAKRVLGPARMTAAGAAAQRGRELDLLEAGVRPGSLSPSERRRRELDLEG
jgi:signal peptide peptidase SppA